MKVSCVVPNRAAIVALILGSLPMTFPSRASAQNAELKEQYGKFLQCSLDIDWLVGWGSDCGTDLGHAYVLIGSVESSTEIAGDEKLVKIKPEEMFFGEPTSELDVTTNRASCMPEIQVGDRWLFYLDRDERSKNLTLSYVGPSTPVDNAKESIDLFRRLKSLGDAGVIQGNVFSPSRTQEGWPTDEPVSNHQLTLKRKSDEAEFTAVTNSKGHFDFGNLPIGSYNFLPNSERGLWAETGPAEVKAKSCTDFRVELLPDGTISGKVTDAFGKPAKYVQVVITSAKNPGAEFQSSSANEDGQYQVRGLSPGEYLVGIGISSGPDSVEWKSRVYYPNVHEERQAVAIHLGLAQKLNNIDLQILASKQD
jgi:hypothetical protein